MRVAMNLCLWTTDPTEEKHLPLYERLKKMGFDAVELPIFDPVPERFARLARRLDDIGLERNGVTALVEHDPMSADAGVRAAAVQRLRAVLDCCQAVGASQLVGPCYATLGKFSGAPATGDEWRRSVDSMRLVTEQAAGRGVTVCLEFLNRFEIYLLNCASDAARFVRDVGSSHCRVLYDTFHAHIEEKSVARALEDCVAELGYVHISENDRSTPGAGQVRWAETFRTLKRLGYDGWLSIEAFGMALPELAAATKIWRRMFADEEQLALDGLAFIRRMWAEDQRSSVAETD